jgi:phospholipase/lecithinase/hemolysin
MEAQPSAHRPAVSVRRGASAILLALFLAVTTGHAFTALYIFGDSLSDTGRNPAPAPEYYDGRYSNGPLWVEYLSAELGIPYNASNNFAVSGSTTADLASQIAGVPASAHWSTALFTLVSGGNDFLQNATAGVNDPFWSNLVVTAVGNLTNAADTLYALGARELVVANLVNLGQTPAFLATPEGYPQYIDSKVALFNAALASGLAAVAQRDAGLRIYALDANTAFGKFLSSPAQYGFTVVTNGALEDTNLTDKSFNGPGANYLFWDVVHPTTKAHALTAAQTYQAVAAQMSVARTGAQLSLLASNLYPGLSYTIQTSTNLLTWSDYQTITPAGTNAIVPWSNGPAAGVFYRIEY